MKVYKKLAAARAAFHSFEIKKSGFNKFAGYNYFELQDFIPVIMQILNEQGLCSFTDLSGEVAILTIVDVEDGSTIEFKTKSGGAALKGCHEIQNLGAVNTYLRRYLWVQALEITEHDVLDSRTGKEEIEKKAYEKKAYEKAETAAIQLSAADESEISKKIIAAKSQKDLIAIYKKYIQIFPDVKIKLSKAFTDRKLQLQEIAQ